MNKRHITRAAGWIGVAFGVIHPRRGTAGQRQRHVRAENCLTPSVATRVPPAFGWAMTGWGAVRVALLPASRAWALLPVGVLLVLAARTPGRDRSVPARTEPQLVGPPPGGLSRAA